jgi:hypothetical protein
MKILTVTTNGVLSNIQLKSPSYSLLFFPFFPSNGKGTMPAQFTHIRFVNDFFGKDRQAEKTKCVKSDLYVNILRKFMSN